MNSKGKMQALIDDIAMQKVLIFKENGEKYLGDEEVLSSDLESALNQISETYKLKNSWIKPKLSEDRNLLLVDLLGIIRTQCEKRMNQKKRTGVKTVKQKFATLEFSTISFTEFTLRIDANSAWLSQTIEFDTIRPVMIEFLSVCKVMTTASEFKQLWKIIKRLQNSEMQTFTFETVKLLLTEWYHDSHSELDLRMKLMKTITEYEQLRISLLPTEDKSALDALIFSLRTQLKKIPNKAVTFNENLEENSRVGLREIFKYYSRQQFLLGKNPTFEEILKNLEVLTIGKFRKFCKDFGIIEESRNDRFSRKKDKVIKEVFKLNSDFNRDMHEHQFFAAVTELADYYLNKEYDVANATDWKDLPKEEKRLKFYEILGAFDPKIYMPKMKDSVLHFGADPTRLPANDPSKKYKYNPEKYKKLKMSIEEWRAHKAEQDQKKIITNRPRGKPSETTKQYRSTPRYPTYEKTTTKTMISPKLNPQKDFIFEKPRYSKPNPSENFPKEKRVESVQSITLQKLSEMKQDDLLKADNDFFVADLIDDSSEDELFTRLLQKNVKTQSNTLAKSISEKTLDRMKDLSQKEKQNDEKRYNQFLKNSSINHEKVPSYLSKK